MAPAEVTAVLLKELLGPHALVASDLLHVTRKEGRPTLRDVIHQVQHHFHLGVVWWLDLWAVVLGRLLGILGILWVLWVLRVFGLRGLLGVLRILRTLLSVLANGLLGVILQTLEKAAEVPWTALAERASDGREESWCLLGLSRRRTCSLAEREKVVLALVTGDGLEGDRRRRLFSVIANVQKRINFFKLHQVICPCRL